jgi:FAD/FMN-containing dehydrogenase/Fe-S oxidoreductase
MEKLIIDGEVYDDLKTRAMYATDASMYQMIPDMVVIPKNESDISKILIYARQKKLPICARGSATSLAGQTVNSGISIDFTKYFNRILSYSPINKEATVQPGVTRDQLNALSASDLIHFGPDPATSNRATFGGMIANNSSGTKSILYGRTIDHVKSLKVMLSDGTILNLDTKDDQAYNDICLKADREGEIYRAFRSLIFKNQDLISSNFPKVMRKVSAYPLDEFINGEPWNMAKIIIGSEGTLAIILEATVNLVPLPIYQNMIIAHFDDRMKGIESVQFLVPQGPASIEVLDYNVLKQSKLNPITKEYHDSVIKGDPDLVLTIEFYGQTHEEISLKAEKVISFLSLYESCFAFPLYNDLKTINDALALRKEGLGLLMAQNGTKKPQAFIEDSAIPLPYLAQYVDTVSKKCNMMNIELVIYAHASVGVLHLRPILDLTTSEDIEKMKELSDFCFQLVKKFGGSWSGEHGDGRNRSPKIKEYFGDELYQCFKDLKILFDPDYRLNPNIIVDALSMERHMRYDSTFITQLPVLQYRYKDDHSFASLVHNCSGVGACRKTQGGTMCPSFRATGKEEDSTRGRANILRLAMSGQMGISDLTEPMVKEVMDLCISCKACKTECPSNVDMSKLKSEVLQLHHDKYGASIQEKLPLYARRFAVLLSGKPSKLINYLQGSSFIRKYLHPLIGIHPNRILPSYAPTTLTSWYQNLQPFRSENKVILFADTYIEYHDLTLGQKCITLLNKCGYEVILINPGCCQRPLISNGFLKEAKTNFSSMIKNLSPYLNQNLPILMVEPSCITAMKDDIVDLIDDDTVATKLKELIIPIEVFLSNEVTNGNLKGTFSTQNKHVLIHGHCHQKASYTTKATKHLLTIANCTHREIDSGCCGMAGAFGYEKQHYDVSKQIYENSLSVAVANSDEKTIVSNGVSCRHQIQDLGGKESVHIIEILCYQPLS